MQELELKRVYKHFKGDYYLVEDVVIHSETREKLVLYRELAYLLFVVYLLSLFYIVTFQDDNYGTSNLDISKRD